MIRAGGYAVLSEDPGIRKLVAQTSAEARLDTVVIDSAAQLATVAAQCGPSAVVIDREHLDADTVLQQLGGLAPTVAILLLGDATEVPPAGAQLMAFESSLVQALELATRPREVDASRLDLLVAVSVLSGPLDEALARAAEQIAAAFGVQRCVIALRDQQAVGGTAKVRRWNHRDRCRMTVGSAATLLAMTEGQDAQCESYVAVPVETALGSHGFLGLVSGTPRLFGDADRAALQAVASRLGAELGWRGIHDSTTDELARLASGPGLDPLLGIWNNVATLQLMAGLASTAARWQRPLTALVIDVVDLHAINTRHGLKTGDLVLRRVADAVRAKLRIEDLLGRWSGTRTVALLPDVTFDDALKVATELHATIATRSIEAPTGERVVVPVTVGIATLQPGEELGHMVARAAAAADRAPTEGLAIAGDAPGVLPALPLQIEIVDQPPITLAGTYRLRHEISRGAMGVIYRADDLALERPVAIKMLRPDLAEDREFIERLRVEAALLARIQHPNLVQIYNFGQVGGDSYFVMELVEGEALQEAIVRHQTEGTKPALAANVAVIEEIASALDALHERGIIHRDVKPGNVIRDPFRGRGVLVDVGIAHRAGQLTDAAGTPGYMAPEVYNGEHATARSDVYGLAATAYAILTLVEPFGNGASIHILARQTLDIPPDRPSLHVPELAPADDIILAGLHRDPAKRPATAGEFARALSSAMATVAPSPRPSQRGIEEARAVRIPDPSIQPQTRGVVFRCVTRVLGVHETARLRDEIGDENPELARALIDTPPLAWLPTALLTRLLEVAPSHLDWDGAQLARDVARASVRSSFRSFFPSSATTLMPERSLSAIRNIWSRYQSWGEISSVALPPSESVVRLTGTPHNRDLCAWTSGMLEQLVLLSRGLDPKVDHDACEALGDDVCRFRVRWEPSH